MSEHVNALLGRCEPCDKRIYVDRKTARQYARQMPPGTSRPRAYQCPHNPDWWHAGHLPQAVIDGHIDRDQYRERKYGGAPWVTT